MENNLKEEKCKACNKLMNSLVWPILLSVYIIGTSIYGTIKLIQLLIN